MQIYCYLNLGARGELRDLRLLQFTLSSRRRNRVSGSDFPRVFCRWKNVRAHTVAPDLRTRN